MKKNRLGDTALYLSELGFGCASAWGKEFYPEREAINIFLDACDAGINYFDTGHSYGNAEVRLGKCLAELGAERRKDLVISTKCGTRIDQNGKYYKDWDPEWLKQSLDISLSRLKTDYIDILNLHSPNLANLPDSVWYFLEDIKKQKVVSAVGASCMSEEDNERAARIDCFDFIMISYNIMLREREAAIERFSRSGKAVVAGSPLAKALYSMDVFKIRSKTDIWYLLRALANNRTLLKKGRDYRFINTVEGMTGNQIALKYVIDNPCVTSAVIGTTSRAHLREDIQALDIQIPEDIRRRINDIR